MILDQLLSEIGGHCGLYLGLSIASLVRMGVEFFRIFSSSLITVCQFTSDGLGYFNINLFYKNNAVLGQILKYYHMLYATLLLFLRIISLIMIYRSNL